MSLDFIIIRDPVTDKQRMNFVNGDFETISGAEECAQRIETALSTVLGEYAFDLKKGLPIFDQIFRKNQDTGLILGYFRNALLKVRGVSAVTDIRLEPNGDRTYKMYWGAIYEEDGTIINGEL